MIKNREFNEILSDFAKSENAKIFIFGSRARGDNYPASDIDVGILFEPGAGDERFKISLIREKFENSNIPQKVDVMNLNEVSENFKSEIMRDAVPWKG
ncbi:nucleotidyltransferase domain-containing protein [bacterium]|nr:nucleotidyltransferase domain-containing protein [bacterium]MBU3955922.1 nucleotidyltransferase domain-containing protein [bacterium]